MRTFSPMMRTLVMMVGVSALLFGGFVLKAHVDLKQNEGKIIFTIPPMTISAYGSSAWGGGQVTSTFRPINCDTDRVIAAFNKQGIPAVRSTTHADKTCIDIEGPHLFREITIDGPRITIVKSTAAEASDENLKALALEIHRAH